MSDAQRASAGGDLLDGGTGSDTADYSPRPPGVVVNLTAGTGSSSGDTDLITALENVTGSSGADTLTGDGSANVLDGAGGNDRLRWLAGADRLAGGAGTDTVDYATFFAASGRIGVVVNLATGEATGDGFDSLSLIEDVDGSSFNDRLIGSGQANRLRGADGRDSITGAGGQDRLRGGDGVDTHLALARDGALDRIWGDAGRDRARVDQGLDVVRTVAILLP